MTSRTDQLTPLDLTGFDTEYLLGLYRRMLQAREFEEQL